jgi:hypothetical protein
MMKRLELKGRHHVPGFWPEMFLKDSMRRKEKVIMKLLKGVMLLCISLAFSASVAVPAFGEENVIRAKLGVSIKSGDQQLRAKAKDRLKAGDLLRLYIYPEEQSYIYVIHTDQKSATLLKTVEKGAQAGFLALPSPREFYEVDGKSPVETFTIICSPEELKEIPALFNPEASSEKWAELEKDLLKKGEIDLGEKPEKPFAIAGNVRGLPEGGVSDQTIAELPVYSGNGILVKQYEFSVKAQ